MSEKVVVTGGAGFIGSHLAEALAGKGYRVTVLDDLSTGKVENLAGLSGIELVEGSITNLPLLSKVCEGARYVFHLAAIASVPRSVEDPLSSHDVNTTGTLKVLLAARDSGAAKVIFASSCAVYGDTTALPTGEDTAPQPMSPYAAAKLAGEQYCLAFQQSYGLAAACMRYFNVYGPRQDPASQYAAVVPEFIKKASEGQPPVIFGDGEQTRDFIYVKDIAAANILAAESGFTGIANAGSGAGTSVNRLAQVINGLLQSDRQPVHVALRAGDVTHSRADISRARALGFLPQYALEEGLRQTIASYRP